MSSTNNENTDFIRRPPVNRVNSSLMNSIGIGNRNSSTSSFNLSNFTAVTDPIATASPTISAAAASTMGIQRVDSPFQRVDSPFQRTDSPFQPEYGMNPLQRTTSIFNETNNNVANPMTPSAPLAQISTTTTTTTPITNPNIQGMPGFMPGAPMAPPPGMMGLYVSQWKYIDHQGDQQGPFPTDLMFQWYHSNYFQPSLQISIVNSNDSSTNATPQIDPLQLHNKFFTLNDLIMKVGNAIDPFTTYDSIVNSFLRGGVNSNATPLPPHLMGLPNNMINPLASSGSGVFPTIVDTIPLSKEMKPPTDNGGGGGGTCQETTATIQHKTKEVDMEGVVADIHSGDYNFNEILDLSLEDNAYYHQVSVPVPMQRKLKKKIDSNTIIESTSDPKFDAIWTISEIARGNPKPFVPVDHPVPESSESVQEEFSKLNVNTSSEEMISQTAEEHVRDSDETKELNSNKEDDNPKAANKSEPTAEEKRKLKAELMAQKLIEEEESKAKQQEAKEAKALRKAKKQKEKKAKKTKGEATSKSDDTDSKPEPSEGDASTKSTSNAAPWATKSKSKGKGIPLSSFFELQKNEELKQQKLEEQKQIEAIKLSEKILKEEQAQEKNKSMLTWAKTGTANDVIPTLDIKAQLLKDQEQKKNARKQSLQDSQMKTLSSVPSDPSFIEEQQRIWEQLQKGSKGQKSNGANAVKNTTTPTATTTAPTTNAWTTVSTKAKKTTTTSTPAKPLLVNKQTKQIGSSTSIPALKNKFVSNIGTISPATVNTRTAAPMYPGNSSISKRQEFLKWCKSQLRLNPGISHNSILEVLLSLPAGPETNEFIADTIYSNSSVMDGRRFAVEFNKRRVECEKQVTDPLSWSEALALPEGNDDDWEFQIVSKKKKGRKF